MARQVCAFQFADVLVVKNSWNVVLLKGEAAGFVSIVSGNDGNASIGKPASEAAGAAEKIDRDPTAARWSRVSYTRNQSLMPLRSKSFWVAMTASRLGISFGAVGIGKRANGRGWGLGAALANFHQRSRRPHRRPRLLRDVGHAGCRVGHELVRRLMHESGRVATQVLSPDSWYLKVMGRTNL